MARDTSEEETGAPEETSAVQTQRRCMKHGLSRESPGKTTRLYQRWRGMKARCLNPNNVRFQRYGGRGIAVCGEWLDYKPFHDWAVANGYREDLSIDRIDNDGDYEPTNCRWVTLVEQRPSAKVTEDQVKEIRRAHEQGVKTKALADKYGISTSMVRQIVSRSAWGWIE
jgi:hypothetical protein